MGARNENRERTWHLSLIVYAIVALSAATDTCGFLRFAPTLGVPAWAGTVCVIPVKLIEWQFLTFATRLWDAGVFGKFASPVPVVPWCFAVCLSALAAHATIYNALASADRAQAKKVETRANLAAAFEGVKAQLGSLSKLPPRPVKVVEQDLAWKSLLDSVRRATRDCTRLPTEGLHEACKEFIELRKELAVATEYERLSNRAEELRLQLAGLDIEAAQESMQRSFNMSIGRWVRIDGRDGIALIGMLLLTIISAFGPFGLDILRRSSKQRQPTTRIASRQGEAAAEPCASVLSPGQSVQAAAAQPAHRPAQASTQGQDGQPAPVHEPGPQAVPGGAKTSAPPAQPAHGPAQPAEGLGARPALGPAQMFAHGNIQQPAQPAHELGAQFVYGASQASAQGLPRQPAQSAQEPAAQSALGAGQPTQDPPKPHPPTSWACDPNQSQSHQSGRPPAHMPAQPGPGGYLVLASAHTPLASHPEELSAVRAFVSMLEHRPQARASGSALAHAYESLRLIYGWPALAPNTFGKLLKIAVQEVGGRKLKSNLQIYEGVRIPAALDIPIAA
jgi:hypothetical protein